MKPDNVGAPNPGQLVRRLALRFRCKKEKGEKEDEDTQARMIGILSLPATPGSRGVLIVTGGPQYRAGSHRQFTLLAQALAARGIPVLRFDYRGMGDSEGVTRDYRAIGPDIDGALAQFFHAVPTLRDVVLWGLCDGATASACHAPQDARISALILLNPWVRSAKGVARATLRHYYLPRLRQPEFWRKLASGGFHPRASLVSLRQMAARARGDTPDDSGQPAPALLKALQRFQGKVLLIESGDDLGAREWTDLLAQSAHWRAVAARSQWRRMRVDGANHTFASAAWRAEVEQLCADWIASW